MNINLGKTLACGGWWRCRSRAALTRTTSRLATATRSIGRATTSRCAVTPSHSSRTRCTMRSMLPSSVSTSIRASSGSTIRSETRVWDSATTRTRSGSAWIKITSKRARGKTRVRFKCTVFTSEILETDIVLQGDFSVVDWTFSDDRPSLSVYGEDNRALRATRRPSTTTLLTWELRSLRTGSFSEGGCGQAGRRWSQRTARCAPYAC